MSGGGHASGRGSEGGFTLVEMLTTMVLLGVVMTSAWMVFGSMNSMAAQTSSTSASSDEARRTLDILTSEIRQAVEPTQGAGVFAQASPWSCSFYCDANRDNVPEKIGYSVTSGAVYRTVQSSLTSAAPFDFSGPTQSRVYVSQLANTTGTPLFAYYDAGGAATTTLADISLARVTIAASSAAGGVVAQTQMSTEVKIRSMNSTVLE
jgi:prepilin-type N-terminal cleavage/methylation domain-containing protein